MTTQLTLCARVDFPRTFAFWGRHTPDGAEPRQRPRHADERSLRFEWRLHGVTTTVELDDLEGDAARIVELVPGERLTLDRGGMVSTWELDGSAGRTRLTFVTSGFDEDDPPFVGWTGWLGGMAALRRYHELPEFRSIWLSVDWPGIRPGVLAEELT